MGEGERGRGEVRQGVEGVEGQVGGRDNEKVDGCPKKKNLDFHFLLLLEIRSALQFGGYT